MAYLLTIGFVPIPSTESYDDVGYALTRVKELKGRNWHHASVPAMSLVDSAGAEIDVDTGLYVKTGTWCVSDPFTAVIAEDTAERSGIHCTGHVDYVPERKIDPRFSVSLNPVNPESDLEFKKRITLLNLQSVRSPDANVEAVREAMLQRSEFGLRKYGATTADAPLGMAGWLQHLQEELMDATVYVQCLKNEVEADNQRLRTLIADAYNAGCEDGYHNIADESTRTTYVAAVLAKLAKQDSEK